VLGKVPQAVGWPSKGTLHGDRHNRQVIQLRVLASSAIPAANWDLRCYLRENLIGFSARD